jgi:hypothetical protein
MKEKYRVMKKQFARLESARAGSDHDDSLRVVDDSSWAYVG